MQTCQSQEENSKRSCTVGSSAGMLQTWQQSQCYYSPADLAVITALQNESAVAFMADLRSHEKTKRRRQAVWMKAALCFTTQRNQWRRFPSSRSFHQSRVSFNSPKILKILPNSWFHVCRHGFTEVVTALSAFVLGVELFMRRSRLSRYFQTAGMFIAAKPKFKQNTVAGEFQPTCDQEKQTQESWIGSQSVQRCWGSE